MTVDALFVFAVLAGTVLAVSRKWLSVDVALMSALGLVTIGGLLKPGEAVEGFAHTAVIAVASLYVVGEAARKFGLFQSLYSVVERRAPRLARAVRRPVGRLSAAVTGETAPSQSEPGRVETWATAAILAGVVLLPLAGLLRFETAALFGAVSTIAGGLVTPEQARRAVNWQIVLVVGALFGLSRAVVESGLVEVVTATPQLAAQSSLSVAVVMTTMLVVSALSSRRAVTSILPVTLTSALFLATGAGL
ncbi:MAG: SLC13 family permease [Bradymonadaceae bacterium]